MISKIEPSQIEWITNGERASALNMNRPLKQFLTKYNINVESINDTISEALESLEILEDIDALLPSKNKVVNQSVQAITENDSGTYNIGTSEITVAEDLPIGFNFYVVADTSLVTISLSGETILSTSGSSYTLGSGVAKFVKIDATRWVVTIEQSV